MYGDDDTHITGQITSAQIAEAIRHKKYGRDMREAIAQGFEQFIGILGRVSNLESEYSDLLSKYNDIIGRLNDDENEIHSLQGDVNALTKKHKDDIEAINQRLTKLEKAVFGYGEYEVNYETPPQTIDHVSEINTDSNPKLKGE
ncbi:hypothetical protein [Lactobacillus amylovorus]|uniref:hypothetical protein n=1 Tax=Lactobacillus amylovorus TaxID=1604 RepID=UPI00232DF5FB|nr:hypothetical protein [Lactobacillus amylovorus]MDB6233524.1 hypothetical protein [Lactobacillus amylovorus]MDB6259658.1 hypothetical protein [Lactobacillus amylovorus]